MFYGQDIDLRCVRMTALNLAFQNLYGFVVWGNSLTMEQRLAYRTGFDGRGFLAELPPEESVPSPTAEHGPERTGSEPTTTSSAAEPRVSDDEAARRIQQECFSGQGRTEGKEGSGESPVIRPMRRSAPRTIPSETTKRTRGPKPALRTD